MGFSVHAKQASQTESVEFKALAAGKLLYCVEQQPHHTHFLRRLDRLQVVAVKLLVASVVSVGQTSDLSVSLLTAASWQWQQGPWRFMTPRLYLVAAPSSKVVPYSSAHSRVTHGIAPLQRLHFCV